MFNFDFTPKIILITAIVQLFIIVTVGFVFSTIVKIFHTFISPYQVFKPKDYFINPNGLPKKYRFIAVKHNDFNEVEDEIAYTHFGDRIHIEYANGKCSSFSTLLTSTIFLMFFPLFAMILLMLINSFETSQLAQDSIDYTNAQIIRSFAGLIFISSFISGTIKLIFDFSYMRYE